MNLRKEQPLGQNNFTLGPSKCMLWVSFERLYTSIELPLEKIKFVGFYYCEKSLEKPTQISKNTSIYKTKFLISPFSRRNREFISNLTEGSSRGLYNLLYETSSKLVAIICRKIFCPKGDCFIVRYFHPPLSAIH